MWLALSHGERVACLVAVDIAPVQYRDRFSGILRALGNLPLPALASRAQADQLLAASIQPRAVRDYLLQNLVRQDGKWQWRINLQALQQGMDEISGFPRVEDGKCFAGPAHFVQGGESDYLRPEHDDPIAQLFPHAERHRVEGAGHWVYADRPDHFIRITRAILAGCPLHGD